MEEKLAFLDKDLIREDVLVVTGNFERNALTYEIIKEEYSVLYVTKEYGLRKINVLVEYEYMDEYVSLAEYWELDDEQKKKAEKFVRNEKYVNTIVSINNDINNTISNLLGVKLNKDNKCYYYEMSKDIYFADFFNKNNDKYWDYDSTISYYIKAIICDKWVQKSLEQEAVIDAEKGIFKRTKTGMMQLAYRKKFDVMKKIANISSLEEIDDIIAEEFTKLGSITVKDDYRKTFINRDLDLYIASHRFTMQIGRAPETPEKAFDYIKISFTVVSSVTLDWLKTNYKPIAKAAVSYIADKKEFKKYGVPVNILKLENISLTTQKCVYFTFGIKKISDKVKDNIKDNTKKMQR